MHSWIEHNLMTSAQKFEQVTNICQTFLECSNRQTVLEPEVNPGVQKFLYRVNNNIYVVYPKVMKFKFWTKATSDVYSSRGFIPLFKIEFQPKMKSNLIKYTGGEWP